MARAPVSSRSHRGDLRIGREGPGGPVPGRPGRQEGGKEMPRIKRLLAGLLLNLYLAFLNFLLYLVLLLLLPGRIPERVLKLQGDLTCLMAGRTRRKVIEILRKKVPTVRDLQQAKKVCRDYFRIQTSFFYYTLFVIAFRVKKWLPRFAAYEGLEYLDASLASHPGVILPTFHFNHPIATPRLPRVQGIQDHRLRRASLGPQGPGGGQDQYVARVQRRQAEGRPGNGLHEEGGPGSLLAEAEGGGRLRSPSSIFPPRTRRI